MGLESFARYQDLCRINRFPQRIGFGPKPDGSKVVGGDINRLNARVRLAQEFEAVQLRSLGAESALGYSGYLQVFLTHSALERFMEIYGVKRVSGLSKLLAPYEPEKSVEAFFAFDRKNRLYDFLSQRLDSNPIKEGFARCKNGEDANIAFVSAAVRHIFAHGDLSANANDINPKKVNEACMVVSDFLLNFINAEFTKTIAKCEKRIENR